jgi:hypothetical protein
MPGWPQQGKADLTGPQRRRLTHKLNHHKAAMRKRRNTQARARRARSKT